MKNNHTEKDSRTRRPLEGDCTPLSTPSLRRYKLKDLLAAMQGELPRVVDWDAMKTVGKEVL